MKAWTVLMDYAMQQEGGRCPFGLVMPLDLGEGVMCQRCEGRANHRGAHYAVTGYPSYADSFIHIRIEWYNDPDLRPIWQPEHGHHREACE
jgi:hypothetical protein